MRIYIGLTVLALVVAAAIGQETEVQPDNGSTPAADSSTNSSAAEEITSEAASTDEATEQASTPAQEVTSDATSNTAAQETDAATEEASTVAPTSASTEEASTDAASEATSTEESTSTAESTSSSAEETSTDGASTNATTSSGDETTQEITTVNPQDALDALCKTKHPEATARRDGCFLHCEVRKVIDGYIFRFHVKTVYTKALEDGTSCGSKGETCWSQNCLNKDEVDACQAANAENQTLTDIYPSTRNPCLLFCYGSNGFFFSTTWRANVADGIREIAGVQYSCTNGKFHLA